MRHQPKDESPGGERVTVRESFVSDLRRQYPDLSRHDILFAIAKFGPYKKNVEVALLCLAAEKAAARD